MSLVFEWNVEEIIFRILLSLVSAVVVTLQTPHLQSAMKFQISLSGDVHQRLHSGGSGHSDLYLQIILRQLCFEIFPVELLKCQLLFFPPSEMCAYCGMSEKLYSLETILAAVSNNVTEKVSDLHFSWQLRVARKIKAGKGGFFIKSLRNSYI